MQILPSLKSAIFTSIAWSFAALFLYGSGAINSPVFAQSDAEISPEADVDHIPAAANRETTEPVFRVSKLNREKSPAAAERGFDAAQAATTENPQPAADSPATAESPATSVEATDNTPFRTASSTTFPSTTPSINPSTSPATEAITSAPHPLDRAIETAVNGLEHIRANVLDYSAIMVKRERIRGVLGCPEYMQMKVRCPRTVEGREVPFSVYFKTLKPKKAAGREVIWVDGENENKLCAHETGLLGMKRFYLEPTGWVAMQSNRYPIFDAGIENLIVKLIERAETAKASGHSTVNYRDNAEIMKRKCSLIELTNEEQREGDEFYKAQVFIDSELQLPVRYVAFDWPKTPGGKPEVIEEYTYVRVSLNQGFRDIDFSPENPAYKFPRR